MISSASYDNIDWPHCTLVLWVQWLLLAELGYKYFRCSGHHTKTSWRRVAGIHQKRQLFGWYLPAHKRLKWFIKLHYSHFYASVLELVSKELNHFGVIADLFRQIGGHSSRFVLFCSFWRLFTIKMIKSVKVFPFSFWKIITKKFFFTS